MNKPKKIAVLLAAYNGEEWIEEQIKSIQNQKGVSVDLYISLDLSIDKTYEILKKLVNSCKNITLLPYGQKFGSAAPNFFSMLLRTPIENYDYISLSDQDDIWLEEKLKNAIDKLDKNNASGYSSNVTAYWSNNKIKVIKKAYLQCEYDYLFESPGPGCSFVLKNELAISVKECLKSTIYLNGLNWHDWVIYAFARKNNFKWVIDDNSYILYRQHENNQLGVNAGYKAFAKRIKDVFSGHGINQTVGIIKLLELESDPFVIKWYCDKKINFLRLALFSKKCRRRTKDRMLFFFACIIMSILKLKINVY